MYTHIAHSIRNIGHTFRREHTKNQHDEMSNERVSLTISITICNSVFSISIQWQPITLFHFFSLSHSFQFLIEKAPVFFTAMNLKPLFHYILISKCIFFSHTLFLQFFWLHKTNRKKMAITLHKLLLSNKLKNDAQSTNLRLKTYHICTRTIEKMWIRRDKEKRIII